MAYNKEQQQQLIDLAKLAIQYGVDHGKQGQVNLEKFQEELLEQRASFVTLEINDQLRGCIGSLQAHQPLAADVAQNAYRAAFADPRFAPLDKDEAKQVAIHISILTPAEPMSFASEEDLLQQLRPKQDGLIIEAEGKRGTFLPTVWESLPEPKQFLTHLKQKAGLPADYWSDQVKVSRYTAELIG